MCNASEQRCAFIIMYLLKDTLEFQEHRLNGDNVLEHVLVRSAIYPETRLVPGIDARGWNLRDQRDIAWARQIRQIENYTSENGIIKDRLQLTLPDVLIGLETWRLRMLSNERGDSVPDLLRNSLDILSLPILKQKKWHSSSLVSTCGYIYILEEDYAISIFFSILKVFFSFSKTQNGTE